MDKERFSLLLLEPGEIYFEDFSAYMFHSDASEVEIETRKDIGRLKMCSKSIVFEPKDIMKPLIKVPLKECTKIDEWNNNVFSKISAQNNVIVIECNQYIEMLERNILAPYTFKNEKRQFLFLLNYAKVSDCLLQICQLHRASTLPAAEQNSMIATIVYSRQSRVSFDTLWLEDLYEKVIMEIQGSKITPLVVNPGRILLTSQRLYFQPYNNIEPYPVLKIQLKDIKRLIKRRFLLRQVGLEIYCDNCSHVNHLYLCLKNASDRDNLHSELLAQSALHLDNTDQEMMTLQWQNGVLSNFDYLLYLNSLGDRTFNDLTQYPVFPWIIADYTSSDLDLTDPKSYRDLSKPIGALNESRLEKLKERYEEMSPPKFLYGSHYSAPGFVLFYLVRKFPHYMLCLQNGRFDHPDRMFNSVPDVWKNVMTNMSDFKELIPAFYDTEQGGDFLVNGFGINFGYRHDGQKVGDVHLPPWANGPQHFVKKMREALESEYVSRNLHHWIDLIFGCRQTGIEAEKANNLFYYLCYEGAVDLDSIKDINQRHALEVQIMEFGQIPKQVFSLPHPQRITGIPPTIKGNREHNSCQQDRVNSTAECPIWGNMDRLSIASTFQSHKEAVSAVAIAESKEFIVSVGQDSLLKMYTVAEKRQVRSVALSEMALSSCVILPDDKTLLVGSWDNNVLLYNLEFGRMVDSVRAHEDAVACIVWGSKSEVLVTGSWDCSVRIWKDISSGKKIKPATSLVAELEHDARITCLSIASNNKRLVSGTKDGDLLLWSLENYTLERKLPGHQGTVFAASFSPDESKLISCSEDRTFKIFDLSSCMQVYSKTLDEELRCLAWDGMTLILGGSLGSLYIWDLVQVTLLKQIDAHAGAVVAVAASRDGSLVVTGGEDRRVVLWERSS
ncbi:protein FAN-like [Schistocerca gregaria]|uniref:protein FAN-like n=1 Tax=Schistocerca gregaria TaxID=7010 RepID=UPI00211DB46B|nr:protein FAN-like [Schistocerca gregaria]